MKWVEVIMARSADGSAKMLAATLRNFMPDKKPFEPFCRLDESSFLYKSFWSNVKRSRQN
jgi:hypothetical protein